MTDNTCGNWGVGVLGAALTGGGLFGNKNGCGNDNFSLWL